MQNQTVEERQKVCDYWLQYIVPKEFPGYVNDKHNTNILIDYIRYSCDGYFSVLNLSRGARLNDSNLHGRGVADTPAQKLAKEKEAAQKKQDEEDAKAGAANDKVIADWIRDECPTGLIVNNTYGCGDPLYGSSQDKIAAFFHRNYPGQTVVTAAILSEAVLTLGQSLDWFDRSPEAMQLRGQPAPPPKKMTEKMMIEAGLKQDPSTIQTHSDDKPVVPFSEVARQAKEVVRKKLGMPSEEDEWQVKAEQISVTTKSGKFDHTKTAEIRKCFATNKTTGKIDWKETYKLRDQLATEILRRQQSS
jgi:hypothetical protein